MKSRVRISVGAGFSPETIARQMKMLKWGDAVVSTFEHRGQGLTLTLEAETDEALVHGTSELVRTARSTVRGIALVDQPRFV